MTLDVVFHENKGRVQADPGLPKPAYHTVRSVYVGHTQSVGHTTNHDSHTKNHGDTTIDG